MKINVLSTEGRVQVDAEDLTFHEHELVLDHWEAVFRHAARPGGPKDEAWLEERLAAVKRARDKLYSGQVPHK